MFAIEHFNTKADMYCIAKGIASGLPLGACVARSGIMDWQPGSHASTFGGNPVSCVAALTTIELLEHGLIENAAQLGDIAMARLHEMETRYDCIGQIRGKGLMLAIEFIGDQITKDPVRDKRDAVVYECFKHGLLLLGAGESAVRFIPPLVITKEELLVGLDIFERVLRKVFRMNK
jgi:4-aminobutyrate aminotransferase